MAKWPKRMVASGFPSSTCVALLLPAVVGVVGAFAIRPGTPLGALGVPADALVARASCRSPPRLLLRGGCADPAMSASPAVHPAVEGWPGKYTGKIGGDRGPRELHSEFTVEKATDAHLAELDVLNWPTWTTKGNEKWAEGKVNKDKVMPYGELSYVLSGKLEVIPPSGERVVIEAGDFVTFPEGFQSTWTCLEELTWHYYLY
jgi:hypothetical protein